MHTHYPHLFSPYRIGNVVLKNRMISSPSTLHFLQGPENYPATSLITHYANRAKNGAALIVCGGAQMGDPGRFKRDRHGYGFDVTNAQTQQYLGQLVEAIHFYGSKCSFNIMSRPVMGYDVSEGVLSNAVLGDRSVAVTGKEMTLEMIEESIANTTRFAKLLHEQNVDGVFIHMSYRHAIAGRFLSPLTNKRTDQYGGSFENRTRYARELFTSIREACGPDFLIEASISGHDPVGSVGGWTLEETARFAQEMDGLLDMLQVRAPSIDPAHPTGYTAERTPWLYMADYVKKHTNTRVAIETIGGFLYPDEMEAALAEGKADLIAMARPFISNPDLLKLMHENRKEDIVPCIRCNKCHKTAIDDPWISVCSVNPLAGMEHVFPNLVTKPEESKQIAVVGGGPAGMKAALTAAERGHRVTLFEKTDSLGGLLKYTDLPDFKWPERDFKNYLINQIEKSDIQVRLNTEATAEALNQEGFDTVIAAVGSHAFKADIPGMDKAHVVTPIEAYWNEAELADDVVVIGSGESGVECGLYLAKQGHRVTILSRRDLLAPDCFRVHFYSMFLEAVDNEPNVKYILNARANGIDDAGVTYLDADGVEHRIPCGSVVAATGQRPCVDEVMRLSTAGDRFYTVGDCIRPGNIQTCMRTAWSIASTI